MKKRRGRPRKLDVGGETLPARSPSKQAAHYIDLLRDLWMDLHGFAGAIIDEHLAWTLEESQRFAEAAYDVCRTRNLLRFLERASEARLLVLVLSIETSKVRQMLETKQQNQGPQQEKPVPMVRQANATPQGQAPDVPKFVTAPKFVSQ